MGGSALLIEQHHHNHRHHHRHMPAVDMPEVTEAHRRAAFEAMRWVGWTYPQAMADTLRRNLVEVRAHQLRTAEWKATRRRATQLVRRYDPANNRWITQRTAAATWTERDPDLFA